MIIQVILHESSAQRTNLNANYKHKFQDRPPEKFCDLRFSDVVLIGDWKFVMGPLNRISSLISLWF